MRWKVGMVHAWAPAGQRFCSAGNFLLKLCSWCPLTGTRLDTGPTVQEGGRWEAASFHSFSAQRADNLDLHPKLSNVFTGLGEGAHVRWHSGFQVTSGGALPFGEVEWPVRILILNPGHTGLENSIS